MVKVFINGEDAVVGRLATFAAKKALEGDEIIIINADKAVFSGSKTYLFDKFKEKTERGSPFHGPFYPKMPSAIVKRVIRGMLPYKQGRGRSAFKRIKVYESTPREFENNKFESPVKLRTDFTHKKYLTVKQVSEFLRHR